MNTQHMLLRILTTTALLAMLSCPIATVAQQTNDGPKILFLNLKLQKDQTMKLVSAITRPGVLKRPANPHLTDGIHYKLVDADGKPLWHAAIADPGQRVMEHTEQAGSGKLKQFRIESSVVEFMVRVPVRTNAVGVEFYRLANASTNQSPEVIRLGVVALPLK